MWGSPHVDKSGSFWSTAVAAVVCVALALTVLTGTFACAARQASATTGDQVLRARVEAALARASDVDADGITVDARRGVVTVTGRVASETEQQSVGAIVRAIPGVRGVSFSLRIEDREDPGALR